jgi:hypothetical protein
MATTPPYSSSNTLEPSSLINVTPSKITARVIIHLLAIHRSLEAMFNNPAHQRAWLTTFHPHLQAIPLELMSKSIDGLIFIRQYLDYVRERGA